MKNEKNDFNCAMKVAKKYSAFCIDSLPSKKFQNLSFPKVIKLLSFPLLTGNRLAAVGTQGWRWGYIIAKRWHGVAYDRYDNGIDRN